MMILTGFGAHVGCHSQSDYKFTLFPSFIKISHFLTRGI